MKAKGTKTPNSQKTNAARAIPRRAGAGANKGKIPFSALERNILLAKGVTEEQLKILSRKGVRCRADFEQIGDSGTLAELAGLQAHIAKKVMSWALETTGRASKSIVVESGDIVRCAHCDTKQPKDYKSGDLCPSCGRQAEPIMACFWCSAMGPGKFCRQCGAEFVPAGELELAFLLKREGLPKHEIAEKLREMPAADKDALWGRIRRY